MNRSEYLTIILALSSLLLATILSTCGASAIAPGTANIADTSIANLQIQTLYPATMEVNQSYVVEIALVPAGGSGYVSDITVEKATVLTSNPTPVGTPGAPLGAAFGAGYTPFATATLSSGTFTIDPVGPPEQLLQQSRIAWDWNVTPLQSDTQILTADVELEWKPVNTGGNQPAYQYPISRPQISVQVSAPEFDWMPVMTTVLGGACLAFVTWLGTQVWKAFLKRKKKAPGNKPASKMHKKVITPVRRRH